MSADEKTFIPESEFPRSSSAPASTSRSTSRSSRGDLHAEHFAGALFIGLPHFFGTWLMLVYGWTPARRPR
jgi:hypothetical protein